MCVCVCLFVCLFVFYFLFFFLIRYYSIKWLSKNPNRLPPHQDHEISVERSKSLEQYFEDGNELWMMKVEFTTFLGGRFPSPNVLTNR